MKNFFIEYPALAAFTVLAFIAGIAALVRNSKKVPPVNNNPQPNPDNTRYATTWNVPLRTVVIPTGNTGGSPGAAGGRFSSVKS